MVTLRHNDPAFPPFSSVTMTPLTRRAVLLHDCDVVLDVGANKGQHASWLRALGYAGRIVSFEPLPGAFAELAELASDDPHWECHNVALGAWAGDALLHVSQNSIGTSVYSPTRDHLRLVPGAAETGRMAARLCTLDNLWPDLDCAGKRVYLKIAAAGGESSILSGAVQVLKEIDFIELELSLAPMYEAAPLLAEILPFLTHNGYRTVAFEPNHEDDETTGQQMMVDGIFTRQPKQYPSRNPDGRS